MNTKPIIFQCPEDLKTEAAEKLANCGVSMSEFLRTCLECFVKRDSGTVIKTEVIQVAEQAIAMI